MESKAETELLESIIGNLGVVKVDTFSKVYPSINKVMMEKSPIQKSRYGTTKEFLNFKTEITNPYNRCVGGLERDMNVFFLLIEALWIFMGRKDVALLKFFNSRMSEFSDNGRVFHAPYGFRLRHYGVDSVDETYNDNFKKEDSNKHATQTDVSVIDQVVEAIKMFHNNPDDRRVVMSIWNPFLDLNKTSKDIPCNDLVMLKIRNNKLYTTIQNRSNDLHWGLPTNIFQFSFLTELMANCLGVELGHQVHNSQSLHIYTENEIPMKMYGNLLLAQKGTYKSEDLYEYCTSKKMEFNFRMDLPFTRLVEIDTHVNILVNNIERLVNGQEPDYDAIAMMDSFCPYFGIIYRLLEIYVEYKLERHMDRGGADAHRVNSIRRINKSFGDSKIDIVVLAKNFFASRVTDPAELRGLFSVNSFIGKY